VEERPLSAAFRQEGATAAQPATVVSAPDPEIMAINATLDKIAALQQPRQTFAALSMESPQGHTAYAVEAGEKGDASFFGRHEGSVSSAHFFGQSGQISIAQGIRARIAGEQQVQSGSTVKLELMTAISVHGINVPPGTFLFGIAYLDGERLRVQVPSIRYANLVLPVSLQVFDLDGIEGVFVPGSLQREIMKESADQAIQSATLTGGLSLAGRAASAGLGAAKDLFSKKLRRARVTLSHGYQVLLQDKQQNAVQ
jgi:conjugative transposon TraM protein